MITALFFSVAAAFLIALAADVIVSVAGSSGFHKSWAA
jgi:hypothetical protein